MKKYDIEEIIEEESAPSIPNEYSIKYWAYNRSVFELTEMFKNEEIIVPSLQREYVWSYEQASLFIDSIARGLPVPSFFVTELNNKLLIIDGLQRLYTLYLYINEKPYESWKVKRFNLSFNNSIIEQIRGKSYSDLSINYQNKILRAMMNIIEFSQLKPNDNFSAMYQIFERINSTGRVLEAQEVRNAAFNSRFNNRLNSFSLDEDLNTLYPAKKDIYKAEMILRYLAISVIVKKARKGIRINNINLKNTLNEYMAILQAKELKIKCDEKSFPHFFDLDSYIKSIDEEFNILKNLLVWANVNIGKDAFRNIKSIKNGQVIYKNSMQSVLCETILIALRELYEHNSLSDDNCRKKIDSLLNKPEYQDLLSKNTVNIDRIIRRIDLMIGVLSK